MLKSGGFKVLLEYFHRKTLIIHSNYFWSDGRHGFVLAGAALVAGNLIWGGNPFNQSKPLPLSVTQQEFRALRWTEGLKGTPTHYLRGVLTLSTLPWIRARCATYCPGQQPFRPEKDTRSPALGNEHEALHPVQQLVFWGCRNNLPYSFGTSEDTGVEPDDFNANGGMKRKSSLPYLEDVGPVVSGHFGPHVSAWFEKHQLNWKTVALGSHFGAAVDGCGDLYLWGSFVPPVVLGPAPILPTGVAAVKDESNHKENTLLARKLGIPELTMVLHQSVASIPSQQRQPTYAEKACIVAGEKYRVFVGPIKIALPFKCQDVKAGVNKLFALTTKGQVYCLDDLIGYLHWLAFEKGLVPVPPIRNPYNTEHSVVIEIPKAAKLRNSQKFLHPSKPTLKSMLPPEAQPLTNDSDGDDPKDASHLVLLNSDGHVTPSKFSSAGEATPETGTCFDGSDADTVEEDTSRTFCTATNATGNAQGNEAPRGFEQSVEPDKTRQTLKTLEKVSKQPVVWLSKPEFFVLKQLPQPGLLWGKGVRSITIGYDHLCCVAENGELFCLGDNRFGQCGVDPDANGQRAVGISRVRHPDLRIGVAAVACGTRHTVFQDDNGVLFALGSDDKLQLGHGDTRQEVGKDLNPTSPVSIAWNSGQAAPVQSVVEYGLLQKRQLWKPTEMMHPTELGKSLFGAPDRLTCSGFSTCVRYMTTPHWVANVPKTTDVYCCGDNSFGQCGSNEFLSQQPSRRVRLPMQFETLLMSCGSNHCAAFLSNGELYAWGDNRFGQTGIKKPRRINEPRVVRFERSGNSQTKALKKALRGTTPDVARQVLQNTAALEIRAVERQRLAGLITDFKDETANVAGVDNEREKKETAEENLIKNALIPERVSDSSNVAAVDIARGKTLEDLHEANKAENTSKPMTPALANYVCDISFIACGFDSTAVIRRL